ncbi:helix-turn-helix domain-containing protein [Natrialbaceae archaeon A-gly3]
MTTVVDLNVHATDTVMGSVFEDVPAATCDMEQAIASDGYRLWITGAKRDAIDTALEGAPSVAEYSAILSGDERWLYDLEFAEDATNVFEVVADRRGTVLNASAADGRWNIRARFNDREDVSRVYDRLVDQDVTVDLVRLTDLTEESLPEHGLTPKQYETLLAAHEHGYFTIPRETSMQELADELGVSHQALSERLRRAYRTLVTTELDDVEDVQAAPTQS